MEEKLSEREKTILRGIIYTFIQTAVPVGSRYISKRHELGLSPATVRNVMSDLEELGYIAHPHTSAGRVPTDKGYRFYVDSLMELERLSEKEVESIHAQLQQADETEELLKETSRIIGAISHQLGVVSAPKLSTGVLEKIELVGVASNRIMVIISITSGLVKTIMMEVLSEIPRTKLEGLSRMLNERLAGLTLSQARQTFKARVKDLQSEETGLVRIFIESVDKLFDESKGKDKVHIAGTPSLLAQPEFGNVEKFRSVIELLDNEDIIVHVLEELPPGDGHISVTIGAENKDDKLQDLSFVTSEYTIGGVSGRVGVIGTKRMQYSKVIPIVDFVARTISSLIQRQ